VGLIVEGNVLCVNGTEAGIGARTRDCLKKSKQELTEM
jgi:hypothetical protein